MKEAKKAVGKSLPLFLMHFCVASWQYVLCVGATPLPY